jgi:hypothetical protein
MYSGKELDAISHSRDRLRAYYWRVAMNAPDRGRGPPRLKDEQVVLKLRFFWSWEVCGLPDD